MVDLRALEDPLGENSSQWFAQLGISVKKCTFRSIFRPNSCVSIRLSDLRLYSSIGEAFSQAISHPGSSLVRGESFDPFRGYVEGFP